MRENSRGIRTNGNQAFNVPCDEEGRTFLRLMRKFINRPRWRFSARGRGPRKRPGDRYTSFSRQLGIPQDESEWLAIYLGGTAHRAFAGDRFRAELHPGYIATLPVRVGATPAPKLTPEEQALLESIMLEAEERYGSETFYSIFQKLVDI